MKKLHIKATIEEIEAINRAYSKSNYKSFNSYGKNIINKINELAPCFEPFNFTSDNTHKHNRCYDKRIDVTDDQHQQFKTLAKQLDITQIDLMILAITLLK